jgi:hypothetical protein
VPSSLESSLVESPAPPPKICHHPPVATSEIPNGHEAGNHRCPECIVITKQTLAHCPACDGLLHRVGDEEVCDGCNKGRSISVSARSR